MPIRWQSPEALIEIGFSQARVVMMNEAHDGELRCIRTREIGTRILPIAHQHGCRYLALEALYPPLLSINVSRQLPDGDFQEIGYLAQPEMRKLVQTALDLDWTLIAYEADTRLYLQEQGFNPDYQTYSPDDWQAIVLTDEFWTWREQTSAHNLRQAFHTLPDDAKMLVWVGWGHHSRVPLQVFGDTPQYAMGYYFEQGIGESIFTIEQTSTIHDGAVSGDWKAFAQKQVDTLQKYGGTAGFMRNDAPQALNESAKIHAYDAYLLSLDNAMTN